MLLSCNNGHTMHETCHAQHLIINLITANIKRYTFLFTITFQDTLVVLVSCHFLSLCLISGFYAYLKNYFFNDFNLICSYSSPLVNLIR